MLLTCMNTQKKITATLLHKDTATQYIIFWKKMRTVIQSLSLLFAYYLHGFSLLSFDLSPDKPVEHGLEQINNKLHLTLLLFTG